MKVFVTGAAGQLGHDVIKELVSRGHEAIGSDIASCYSGTIQEDVFDYISLDITDKEAVLAVLMKVQPVAVVHCAAWTAVDLAEEPQNIQKVYAINVEGT